MEKVVADFIEIWCYDWAYQLLFGAPINCTFLLIIAEWGDFRRFISFPHIDTVTV